MDGDELDRKRCIFIPGLPVSSIPQCKQNLHQDACLELFHVIGHFEPTFIKAQQASKKIWKVRSLKPPISTRSLLAEIITSSNKVFKDLESNMAVGIRTLGNATCETAESNLIVTENADS